MTLKDLIESDVQDVFLNTDEFAETVTFRTDAGGAVSVTGIVGLDEPLRDTEAFRPTIYTGSVSISEADRSELLTKPNELLTVETHGYTWRVVDVGVVRSGMFEVAIQRESSEHSNAVDLQGNQHRYGD